MSAITVSKKNFKDFSAQSFTTKIRGEVFHGFVIKKNNKYFAYQNLCRHLSVTLDLNDADFFTHDKKHLQCQMHGAIYEIETGLCIAGPCVGAKLISIPFSEEENRLVIKVPENLERK